MISTHPGIAIAEKFKPIHAVALGVIHRSISVLISGIISSHHQVKAILLNFELPLEFKTLFCEKFQAGIHSINVIKFALIP